MRSVTVRQILALTFFGGVTADNLWESWNPLDPSPRSPMIQPIPSRFIGPALGPHPDNLADEPMAEDRWYSVDETAAHPGGFRVTPWEEAFGRSSDDPDFPEFDDELRRLRATANASPAT